MRRLLAAALDGSLRRARFRTDPHFGFEVPTQVEGIEASILDPRSTWADPVAYDQQAEKLVRMFAENFGKFEQDGSRGSAAPEPAVVAAV